ncbi:MAG: RagB/SusD family nutrient uptake outer membrane protein [Muribaculaceae bacterium]|nr:RagB/SusD family nutrient uptake outer membrane protein [Muribaculaceae bacterium]
MKINKIYGTVMAVALGLSAGSCDLDPKVYSSLTDENFPKSLEDIDALVTGLYGNFKSNSGGVYDSSYGGWELPIYAAGGGWWAWNEFTTDECNHQSSSEMRFNWTPTSTDYNVYTVSRDISRATYILDQLEKRNDGSQALATKIAEVKALRAWHMFCFYDLYGPISVILDPKDLDNVQYMPRPSKEEYFNRMINDLKEALPDLYEKTNGTANWGRVNKALVSMLIMKAYMNEHRYAEAEPYAKSILDMGYSLAPTYREIFTKEQCDETIWAVPSGETAGNEYFYYCFPPNCITWGENFENPSCPTARWGGYIMPWRFYDTFDSQDVRLQHIAYQYKSGDGTVYTRPGAGGASDDRIQQGAIPIKYFVDDPNRYADGNTYTLGFRLADVYLSLAEIECELRGPTQTALDYLKKTTDRAGVSHTIPADIQSSKDKFMEFLLMERGHELFMEGWRRQDLIRHGKFVSSALERGWSNAKDYMVKFPIPNKVIVESGGVIEQNDGY